MARLPSIFFRRARHVGLSTFVAYVLSMNVQDLPKFVTDAYTMFDSLNLSVTALAVIGFVLALVCLFALREAAAWFFKIDDLKKDVKKVSQLVVDMEAEVRSLQALLSQNVQLATDQNAPAPGAPVAGGSKDRFTVTH